MAYLTAEQVAQFEREGYLVVEDLLDPERDLDPIIAEYEGVLDRLANELYAAGKIASTYDDLPFSDRLTRIYAESGKVHAQYFDFSLPQDGITTETPFWTGPAVFSALRHEGILDAIESLIGPEIYSNPVQHVRLKPPEHLTPKDPKTGLVQLGATPWHQDNGVINEEADETDIITVWFPLTDATIENGCLAVVPFSHEGGCCRTARRARQPVGVRRPHQGAPLRVGGGGAVADEAGSGAFMTRRTVQVPSRTTATTSGGVSISATTRSGNRPGAGCSPGSLPAASAAGNGAARPGGVAPTVAGGAGLLAERGNPTFNRWHAASPVCA